MTEGQTRALRSELGLNEMGGQQANTIMQQIADGEVDPDDLKKIAEESQQDVEENEKKAQEEADEARKASLEKQQKAAQDESAAAADTTSNDDLDGQTVDQLREQAKDKNVSGYSSMNKQELIDAIRGS
jgi:hypothetical protein